MHVILSKPDADIVVVSKHSHEYNDYLLADFKPIFSGTKKECLSFLEEIEND